MTIRQARFTGNSASRGSVVGKSGFDTGTTTMENVLITGNTATTYTISLSTNQANVLNLRYVTMANNTGGGAQADSGASNSDLEVLNSILVNNGATGLTTDDPTPTVAYNDVFGHATNYGGTIVTDGNDYSVDPILMPSYYLRPTSPVAYISSDIGIYIDLDGLPRPVGGGAAIGAFNTLVPEPATAAALLVAGGCGLFRRRRE